MNFTRQYASRHIEAMFIHLFVLLVTKHHRILDAVDLNFGFRAKIPSNFGNFDKFL